MQNFKIISRELGTGIETLVSMAKDEEQIDQILDRVATEKDPTLKTPIVIQRWAGHPEEGGWVDGYKLWKKHLDDRRGRVAKRLQFRRKLEAQARMDARVERFLASEGVA